MQRLTFDQAEQSQASQDGFYAPTMHVVDKAPLVQQATEDGFQRIREVTGLTDVMEIVQKLKAQTAGTSTAEMRNAVAPLCRFLHREDEHEQCPALVEYAWGFV